MGRAQPNGQALGAGVPTLLVLRVSAAKETLLPDCGFLLSFPLLLQVRRLQ